MCNEKNIFLVLIQICLHAFIRILRPLRATVCFCQLADGIKHQHTFEQVNVIINVYKLIVIKNDKEILSLVVSHNMTHNYVFKLISLLLNLFVTREARLGPQVKLVV
jgi:hypothetical protein